MYNDMEDLKIDFVYVPEGGSDFINIKIIISFAKEKLLVEFFSEHEVSTYDLSRIIESLQKNNFDKLKIDLYKSSNCFLYYSDITYKINMSESISSEQEITLIKIQ